MSTSARARARVHVCVMWILLGGRSLRTKTRRADRHKERAACTFIPFLPNEHFIMGARARAGAHARTGRENESES